MQVHSETMYFASILFLLCALSLVNGDPIFFRGRPWGRHGMMGTLRKTSQRQLADREPITGQWLEQQLNHFDPSDTRTWKQRFFVNDQFFQPGNPVFLQLGGEGTADPVWLVDGQIAQNYGPKLGAMLIYVEHRYYGQSHPTPDMSVDNLKFLTSQQALADFANFITQYTASNPNLQTSKWVTFGGSYSGSLSAWMRLKYPHLVHAAVASSAPVNAVVNFKQYLGVVRDSLGSECDSNIEQATEQVAMLLQHPLSWRNLNSMFTLCDPLDGTNVNDVANFVQSLSGNFEGVVQYNRDNRAFEGAVDGNVTIDVICDLMQDASLPYVKRYANVNSLILKTYGQKCLDYKYGDFIELLKGESWNTSAAEGGRQWTYQTCVEFGFFQSSDLANQPFGKMFPVSFFEQQCKDIFGDKFTVELLENGVNFTNTYYGAQGLRPSRVIFPNGSIDPWHALGITANTQVGWKSQAVYINGTAHCADSYPSSSDDLAQLTEAREQILTFLQNSLSDD